MFNILTDTLPDRITVGNDDILINTSFKTWIKFICIMSNNEMSNAVKLARVCKLCIGELPKSDTLSDLMEALVTFSGGIPSEEKAVDVVETSKKAIYDFEIDSKAIYNSFMAYYHIDLLTADLHWWQFKTLFDGLGEETEIMKIIGYRTINLSKIKDKEQKSFYQKMKQRYALPDNRTEEEKEKDMNNMLAMMF